MILSKLYGGIVSDDGHVQSNRIFHCVGFERVKNSSDMRQLSSTHALNYGGFKWKGHKSKNLRYEGTY